MSAFQREAHDVWCRRPGDWPEDSRDVAVVDRGLPMHGPDMATTVTVEGCDIVLADRPAVPPDRALGACCIVETGDHRALIDYVAAMPAVQSGAVVERLISGQHVARAGTMASWALLTGAT